MALEGIRSAYKILPVWKRLSLCVTLSLLPSLFALYEDGQRLNEDLDAALNLLDSSKTKFDKVQLTDMTGRIVLNNQFGLTSKKDLDLSNLPNGVYTISLMNSTEFIFANRIVVNK